jgi:hypothetical protein
MLKPILYLGLTAFGIIGALWSPLIGAIACIEAYLLNPPVFQMNDGGFHYQLWTTVAFFAGLLLHRPRPVQRVANEGAILWLLWAFVAFCAASAVWAEASAEAALTDSYEMFKTVAACSALIWAICSTEDASRLMTAFTVGVFHAGALHTFGVRLGYIPAIMDRDEGVLNEGQSPVMVIFVPLLLLLIIKGSKVQRIAAAIALPFVLNSIVKSYQRTAFIGVLVELIIMFIILPKRFTLRALPVLAAFACLFVYRLTPENYWTRMETISDPHSEASAESRFVIAQVSTRIFEDHPLGVGYKNYQYVSPQYVDASFLTEGKRSSHNSFFAILCDLGVVGFAIWIGAIGMSLRTLRQVRKRLDWRQPDPVGLYAVAAEVGLYGWLSTGLTGDQSGLDPAYWFMALAVILMRLSHQRSRELAEANSNTRGLSVLGDVLERAG